MKISQFKLRLHAVDVCQNRQNGRCMVPPGPRPLFRHPVELPPRKRSGVYADESCKLVDVSFDKVDPEFRKSVKLFACSV